MARRRMGLYVSAALALLGCQSSNAPADSIPTDGSIDRTAAEDVTTSPDDAQSDASIDAETQPVDGAHVDDANVVDAGAADASDAAPSYDGSCVATFHLGGGQCNWMVDCPGDASFHATCFYVAPPMNCNCNNGSTVIVQNTGFCSSDPRLFFESANATCGWEAGLSGPPIRN